MKALDCYFAAVSKNKEKKPESLSDIIHTIVSGIFFIATPSRDPV